MRTKTMAPMGGRQWVLAAVLAFTASAPVAASEVSVLTKTQVINAADPRRIDLGSTSTDAGPETASQSLAFDRVITSETLPGYLYPPHVVAKAAGWGSFSSRSLHVTASLGVTTSGTASNIPVDTLTIAQAQIVDTLTLDVGFATSDPYLVIFNSPVLEGSLGLSVSSTLLFEADALASANLVLVAPDGRRAQSTALQRINTAGLPPGASTQDKHVSVPLNNTQTWAVQFVPGENVLMGLNVNAQVIGNGNAASEAVFSDFQNTLRWSGIAGVTTLDGNPVPHWTLASESGTDWTLASAVPEPTPSVLLCIGLLGLTVWRHRTPPSGDVRRYRAKHAS